ncbi:MAG TPA: cellulase family glycosylhydrolase [Planctomycetota bacterium]|nr:cellulase family glycosylhydrolase [Planctomycetota bacterium]
MNAFLVRASVGLLATLVVAGALHAESWWERGADTWYYKDDWKGLALEGSKAYSRALDLPDGAAGGWIVVWGDRGYTLKASGKLVGRNVDGGLIDDYDLKPFIEAGATKVTLLLQGSTVCAEGELMDTRGKRHAFTTGDDWQTADRKKPKTRKLEPGPSHGAFHRAHNGRLLSYNDEERGKAAIARCLARAQRLREQGIFLLRRARPADEVLSFAPETPWRRAEAEAATLLGEAQTILKAEAIPAQKAGNFAEAIATAALAARTIADAECRVLKAAVQYRAARDALGAECEAGLRATGPAGRCSRLDEFPDDRFAWLNARELMGNDPAAWPFAVAPAACDCIDLGGLWDFCTDPQNAGIQRARGWRKLSTARPWERQGVTQDNPRSPDDAPYKLHDARTGDKPYNGFAWYRKSVHVPVHWQGRKLLLATGSIANWARVFINGKPLGEGKLGPPPEQEISPDLFAFGKENELAIQVYNHDNFGGITGGPLALYVAGGRPEVVETPGPLSFVTERTHPTAAGPVRTTLLAGALSPGVLVATDGSSLELLGWEGRGHPAPTTMSFVTAKGLESRRLNRPLPDGVPGADLAENWLLLRAPDRDALVVLGQVPLTVSWKGNRLGTMSLVIACEAGPVRAAILVLPEGEKLDIDSCHWWARVLRRYPVTACELVREGSPRTCRIRYGYADLGGFGAAQPLSVAPVPMLISFALRHKHPGVALGKARTTEYRSEHAPYIVVEDADTVEYRVPPVDRSKVMKGVGELFGKMRPEHNARGGLAEDVMFQRMGEWGFDHCRYAFAFHANWDLPLAKFMGGPIIEDNEAAWKRLDQLIEKTNAAGVQMMLCWFFNEDQPQADTGGAVRNSTRYWRAHPEAQKNAFELWRRIAARYADKPEWAISYDFFNEPAYMNPAHWNQVIKELTAVIRSVDKRHLIVWESADGWAQPHWCLWMEPAKDPNVLYSFHHYGKHWGYAYDEYYPSYKRTHEQTHVDPWLHAILFGIRHHVPIHCGEFGISMIQPTGSGEAWLEDYLAFFERFGIGWNWWNYSGQDIYRTGLAAGDRISPFVPILRKWADESGWGAARRKR